MHIRLERDFYRYTFSANDSIASNQFSYYWGNFAYSGNPSSGDVTSVGEYPEWPEYSSTPTPDSWESKVVFVLLSVHFMDS